jgi:ATP-dependent Zn protease
VTSAVQSVVTWVVRFFTMKVDLSAKTVIYHDVMEYINYELSKSNTVVPEYDLIGGNSDEELYRRTTPKSSFWLNLGFLNYVYVVPNGNMSTSVSRSGMNQFGISSSDIKTSSDISLYFVPRINCIERLNQLINKSKEFHQNKQKVTLYENSGGAWIATKTLNPRNMKTVYLPKQIESEILDCIQNFQNDQAFFKDNGFSSRYTFLFSGLPGVGKTSTIISLASQLNMDIYYLSLKSKISDFMTIGQLMNNIKKDSILMIEDLDRSVGKAVKDTKQNNSNTLFGQMNDIDISDLLNCFDGVMSPSNVLIFITANNTDNLPKALLRPGRINKHIRFPAITMEVFNKIVTKFYDDEYKNMPELYNETLENILARNVSVATIMATVVETRRLKMGIEHFLNELKKYDPSIEVGYTEHIHLGSKPDSPPMVDIENMTYTDFVDLSDKNEIYNIPIDVCA